MSMPEIEMRDSWDVDLPRALGSRGALVKKSSRMGDSWSGESEKGEMP
jgi:hypothetical protein